MCSAVRDLVGLGVKGLEIAGVAFRGFRDSGSSVWTRGWLGFWGLRCLRV